MNLLNHIAIPVAIPADVRHFYHNVLGFTEKYRFTIDENTVFDVFGLRQSLNVAVVERDGLVLELYQTEGEGSKGISHVCLNVPEVENICIQARSAGYAVVNVRRPEGGLAFITDGSGNRFEIKQGG